MSNQVNTELEELASEHIMYWEGTPMARVLEADLEASDLEALEAHIQESAKIIFDNEYNPEIEATDAF